MNKPKLLFSLGLIHVLTSNALLWVVPTWQLQLAVMTWLIVIGMIPAILVALSLKEGTLMANAISMIIPLVGFGCAFSKLAIFGHREFYMPAILILVTGCLSVFLSLYRDSLLTIRGLSDPETRRIFLDHLFDLLVASMGLGVICYVMIFRPLESVSFMTSLNSMLAITTWLCMVGLIHRSFATSMNIAMIFMVIATFSSLNANSYLSWEAAQHMGDPYTVFRFHGFTISMLIMATVHTSFVDFCQSKVEPLQIGFFRAVLIGGIASITPIVGINTTAQDASVGGFVTAFMVLILLVRMVQMVQEREQRIYEREVLTKALQYQATHDPLTGLSNRSYLLSQLTKRLGEEQPDRVTILYCDLNRFKPVNDRFGHAAGDQVLKEVANRLRESVGTKDILGRLGGDEFVVVVTNRESVEDIERLQRQLIQRISQHPYTLECGDVIYLGLAIGVAHATPGANADQLIALADADMYEAKHPTNRRLQDIPSLF